MRKTWQPEAVASATVAKAFLADLGITEPPPPGVPERLELPDDQFFAALRRDRLEGIAARLAGTHPELPLADAMRARLRAADRGVRMRQLVQTSAAVSVRDALEGSGIPTLFIKGAFQSELLYRDSAVRGLGDLDILVAEEDFRPAVEALERIGAQTFDIPTDDRIARKLARVHHAAALELHGTSIDLHRRVDPSRHSMPLDVRALSSETTNRVAWNSREFATLSRIDTAILIACHGCKDGWSEMRSVVDFAAAVLAPSPPLSTQQLMTRARSLHAQGRVEVALAVARMLVPEIPTPTLRARQMAQWAWSRHRHGRNGRFPTAPHEAAEAFAYASLAEGDGASLGYGLMRLAWLPSALVDEDLSIGIRLGLPATAPILVARRVIQRSRTGSSHPRPSAS